MSFDLSRFWDSIVRVFKIFNVSAISIVTVFLSWFCLFNVGQVTDAIIALGDFGSLHHFVILILVGSLWAFFVWYWARVFYYIEYKKRTDLKEYEKIIVKHTPRVLGTLALLIIGLAFLIQAPKCQTGHALNPLFVIGAVFLVLAVIFSILVNLRRKILKLKPLDELQESLEPIKKVVPVTNLPNTTKKILIFTTIATIILLILITISPIQLTMFMGDGVTVLLTCFCIWLPLLYWVRYFSLKIGFPLFLVLAVLIISFSFFNSNKSIRLVNIPGKPVVDIDTYTEDWFKNIKKLKKSDSEIPMIIVLSEGGGIRASYWSAQLLARIQKECPHFRDYLFCISSVSGGSFGATVFDGVMNYYDNHPQEVDGIDPEGKNVIQRKITDIIGKDYLSPTIACLFTREIIQLLIPFPIQSFDRSKVFEETWEYFWEKNLNNDSTFSEPFLSMWSKKSVPPIFINTTQVETGYPVILSNIRLDNSPEIPTDSYNRSSFYLPRDFYADILNEPSKDVPLSTASLLSARFPFVAPAGTIRERNAGIISLVDGGYFDNTGANTAYRVLFNVKKWHEDKRNKSTYLPGIKPIIVYLTNGINVPDKKASINTMLDQLVAPIETSMQIRDSNTKNNLLKLMDLVKFYKGEFITYSLPKPGDKQTDIPLGWALSSKVQKEIDDRVKEIDINKLADYIN